MNAAASVTAPEVSLAMRDKRQVGHQFSRAASSYDQAAGLQLYAVEQLLEKLRQLNPDGLQGHWLDIGCGTGVAFEPLLQQGIDHLTGLDLAEGMLGFAQSQHRSLVAEGKLDLTLADADQLPFNDAKPDSPQGIFSSLMLQWSENPKSTLTEWHRVMKPGGTLAVATLLPGTHQEIAQTWQAIDDYRHVNRFAEESELANALTESGFELVWQRTEMRHHLYPDVRALLRGLKAIGATNVNTGRRPGLNGRKLLNQFELHYPKDEQGQCPLSYHIYWLIARRI